MLLWIQQFDVKLLVIMFKLQLNKGLVILFNLGQISVLVPRVEEPSAAFTVEDDLTQSLDGFELQTTEQDVPEFQNPFKSASRRLGVRLESSRDSERYLHRILH